MTVITENKNSTIETNGTKCQRHGIGLATWTKQLVKGPDVGRMEVLESQLSSSAMNSFLEQKSKVSLK